MSWEGYYHILCENGHRFTNWSMPYENGPWIENFDEYPEVTWTCPICGAKMIWFEIINVTNGSDEETGEGIATELEFLDEKICVCEKCGVKHHYDTPTYKMPKKSGFYIDYSHKEFILLKNDNGRNKYEKTLN